MTRIKKKKMVGTIAEQQNLSHRSGGSSVVTTLLENCSEVSCKAEHMQNKAYDLIIPRELHTHVYPKICIRMSLAALLTPWRRMFL